MVPVRLYASAGGLAAGMSGLVTGYSHDFPAPPSAARDMRSDMSKRARVIINADDPVLVSRVRAALQDQPLELICDPVDCTQAPLCRWLAPDDLNQCGQLVAAIQDAIATLEQTRHAFRSKQLGSLRQRLEKVGRELPEPG